jgi:hypothetical protein
VESKPSEGGLKYFLFLRQNKNQKSRVLKFFRFFCRGVKILKRTDKR